MQANKERAAEIARCGALTCVAGAAYADFLSGWQFVVPVVDGAAVPALLVAVATQRALRPGRAALVGVLLLSVTVAALLLVLPGTGVSSVGDAARTVVDGTVDGWAAMLAAGLPADLHGDLLVTPLAPTGAAASDRLALAAAFLGLALVLVRANRAVATALTEALPGAGAPSPGGAPELAERGPAPYPGRPGRVRCTPRRGDREATGGRVPMRPPVAAPTRLPEPEDVQAPPGRPSNAPSDASRPRPPIPRRSSRPRSTVKARAAGGSAPRPPGASPPSWPCSACLFNL
jgi:hypothetical protein